MYSALIALSEEYNADIVDSLIQKINEADTPEIRNERGNVKLYNAETALSELMKDKTVRQTPCNKLYRSSVIGNTRFTAGKYIDDEYWTYKVVGNSSNYVFTDAVYYYYVQHSESAMGREYSLSRIDAVDALMERRDYIRERFPRIFPEAEASYFGCLRFHFQMLCYYNELDPDKKFRNELLDRVSTLDKKIVLDQYCGKQRMWVKAFYRAPYFTSRIRNLFKIGW